MILKNNRAPLLSNIQLYASFHHHDFDWFSITFPGKMPFFQANIKFNDFSRQDLNPRTFPVLHESQEIYKIYVIPHWFDPSGTEVRILFCMTTSLLINGLLMPQLLTSPDHQQPSLYWLRDTKQISSYVLQGRISVIFACDQSMWRNGKNANITIFCFCSSKQLRT